MKTQKDTKSVMRAFSTIIAVIMLLCSISAITGCKNNDNSNNNNSKAEVVLDKVSAAAYTDIAESETELYFDNHKHDDDNIGDTLNNSNNYSFVLQSEKTINFDIQLDNRKNYYIMDFRLTCEDDELEYYDNSMEEWTPINDVWIRWSGSNNQKARYKIKFTNKEISTVKIKISDMYYSDRNDGRNKRAVNMNKRENFTIHKIEDSLANSMVTLSDIINTETYFTFKINKIENTEITEVTYDGSPIYPNDTGLYKLDKNGKLVVNYKYKLSETIYYTASYDEDIELFNVVFLDNGKQPISVSKDEMTIFDVQLFGSYIFAGISDPVTGELPRYEYNNCHYFFYANAIVILNPEFDDFDEYINTTMIKIAGEIYPLTKFVRSDYDLQDYRNVN